jgi:hypothetical protein
VIFIKYNVQFVFLEITDLHPGWWQLSCSLPPEDIIDNLFHHIKHCSTFTCHMLRSVKVNSFQDTNVYWQKEKFCNSMIFHMLNGLTSTLLMVLFQLQKCHKNETKDSHKKIRGKIYQEVIMPFWRHCSSIGLRSDWRKPL